MPFREDSYEKTNLRKKPRSGNCTRKPECATSSSNSCTRSATRSATLGDAVAYYALIASDKLSVVAGADAAWFRVSGVPPLAFDHRKILDYALERLRNKLEYTTVGFQLLPEKFTLGELQEVYEAILGRQLDKRNFRRKIALLGIVKPLRQWRRRGRKPARLFRFAAARFERLKDRGILFPF
jgi:8-oxo-dGTP diphosphatase